MSNRPAAEILSQGNEVVSGQVVDTNAAWLSQRLQALGFDVVRHTAVGDRLDDLEAVLLAGAERADLCICTGGLGPTCDDLTSEAVARAFGVPLVLDEVALSQIKDRYRQRGLPMPQVNRKQAMLPLGAVRIDNLWGTAPGFRWQHGDHRLYFLPGVPAEMREMFNHAVEPELRWRSEPSEDRWRILRTFGAGESLLQEWVNEVALPETVELGFCVDYPYVDVKLGFSLALDIDEIEEMLIQVRLALRGCVFAQAVGLTKSPGTLAERIDELMAQTGWSLSVIDAGCGGELVRQLAATGCFQEAMAVSTADQLLRYFGLNDLDWPETMQKVAVAFRERTATDVVLVVARTKEADHIDLILLTPKGMLRQDRRATGRWQESAAAWVLDVLRRHLMGEGLP